MGVLLYALLCGSFPFKGQSDRELYRRIAKGAFVCPRNQLQKSAVQKGETMQTLLAPGRLIRTFCLQATTRRVSIISLS